MICLRYMEASIEEQTIMDVGCTRRSMSETVRSLRSDLVCSALDRSLRSDRLVRGSVATKGPTEWLGRLLRNNRPSGLVGRYVTTDRVAWLVAT
ncbi:hypothetical protein F2Q68_00031246 [Brassica cretica]|nr:hypothetical protein F2Q68_00031246 [Brassica cretica]